MEAHRALFDVPSGAAPSLGEHFDLVASVAVVAASPATHPALVLIALAALVLAAGRAFWAARRGSTPVRRVGPYVLHQLIGSGGMGEVWSARHPSIEGELAVKLLHRDRALSGPIARFKREIRVLGRLSHPNIVRVLDGSTTSEGVTYLAMELVRGDSLKRLVHREGPLPPARAIAIVRQIASALAEAHAQGVVHRDLKPENILVTREGDRDVVKVLDFGIAKHRPEGNDFITALTHAGMIVGTPAYMSPEQAASREVDERSDIYSLGAVLFHALTGRPPFEGTGGMLLLYHISKRPPLASAHAPHRISAQLDMVVQRCLAKDPQRRYDSMLDLEQALSRISSTEEAEAPAGPTGGRHTVQIVDADSGVRPVGQAAADGDQPVARGRAA